MRLLGLGLGARRRRRYLLIAVDRTVGIFKRRWNYLLLLLLLLLLWLGAAGEFLLGHCIQIFKLQVFVSGWAHETFADFDDLWEAFLPVFVGVEFPGLLSPCLGVRIIVFSFRCYPVVRLSPLPLREE